MISERYFATSFTSFWQPLLPSGDAFVRYVNLSAERFDSSLDDKSFPNRRSITNEASFRLYRRLLESKLFTESASLSLTMLRAFFRSVLAEQEKFNLELNDYEKTIAQALAIRLYQYFLEYERTTFLTVSPSIPGCGFISTCKGDILAGDTLSPLC